MNLLSKRNTYPFSLWLRVNWTFFWRKGGKWTYFRERNWGKNARLLQFPKQQPYFGKLCLFNWSYYILRTFTNVIHPRTRASLRIRWKLGWKYCQMSRKGEFAFAKTGNRTFLDFRQTKHSMHRGFIFVIQSGFHAANNASLKVGGEQRFCPVGKSLFRNSQRESSERRSRVFPVFEREKGRTTPLILLILSDTCHRDTKETYKCFFLLTVSLSRERRLRVLET